MRILTAPAIVRCLVVSLAVLGIAAVAPDLASAADPQVEILWGVEIPMRDGITLNATVYKPLEMEEPLPVVFTLTPYTSDTYHERGWYFARHGYVFALVDVRGRGNSEGVFDPFAQEAEDGYDAVEWIAEQSWCNGKVAMWGGSYAGYDQWATAKEFPPHLATIVPAAAAFAGVDFPFWKNIPFYFFSRAIAEGSRLRLVFKSPNSIQMQKNYNSGGVVAEESGADSRTATVTLYHDAVHSSFLEIPIVR